MAKRHNGVGNMKQSRSHKTKKRLAIRKEMIEEAKLRPNSRHYDRKAHILAKTQSDSQLETAA